MNINNLGMSTSTRNSDHRHNSFYWITCNKVNFQNICILSLHIFGLPIFSAYLVPKLLSSSGIGDPGVLHLTSRYINSMFLLM